MCEGGVREERVGKAEGGRGRGRGRGKNDK